jgi:hypothetical protein
VRQRIPGEEIIPSVVAKRGLNRAFEIGACQHGSPAYTHRASIAERFSLSGAGHARLIV